ncbi:hypothetical protein PHLGIDRAFT_37708 [Phlebiopsis gigantea 11061_1 CR5-6]|uniref:Uncharacterized protein n=1 Tax=Phlebiopsis gigantea (strain 11061_1 CR5-6) TaxID=745531 RepID=A0A0C3S4A3_PHLG1|nr:hypothetical protein PHLGIDRAFT_37708 [Phlebiopsis gigantea 11061_1 CR5-6]
MSTGYGLPVSPYSYKLSVGMMLHQGLYLIPMVLVGSMQLQDYHRIQHRNHVRPAALHEEHRVDVVLRTCHGRKTTRRYLSRFKFPKGRYPPVTGFAIKGPCSVFIRSSQGETADQLASISGKTLLSISQPRGIYVVLFIMSSHYILSHRASLHPQNRRTSPNKPVICGSVILFATITSQWILVVVGIFQGFVVHGKEPSGTLGYFSDLSNPVTLAGLGLFDIQAMDYMAAKLEDHYHACFHSYWGLAAALFIADILAPTPITQQSPNYFSTISAFNVRRNSKPSAKQIAPVLACTVGTNVYCTALISYKVWQSERAIKNSVTYLRSSTTSRVISIIVESALIFTASFAVVLFTAVAQSNAIVATKDMASPLTGIAYCLIIIRFGMGGGVKRNEQISTILPQSQNSATRNHNIIPLHPIAIRTTYSDRIGSVSSETVGEDAKKVVAITAVV